MLGLRCDAGRRSATSAGYLVPFLHTVCETSPRAPSTNAASRTRQKTRGGRSWGDHPAQRSYNPNNLTTLLEACADEGSINQVRYERVRGNEDMGSWNQNRREQHRRARSFFFKIGGAARAGSGSRSPCLHCHEPARISPGLWTVHPRRLREAW